MLLQKGFMVVDNAKNALSTYKDDRILKNLQKTLQAFELAM